MDDTLRRSQSWIQKFRNAFRGVKRGVRGQSSFFVHFFFAAAVILAGLSLNVTTVEWCLLILCIALVLVVELLNTAMETMAKAVSPMENPYLRDALDMASGAVLLAACGAVAVGILMLGGRLAHMLGWMAEVTR